MRTPDEQVIYEAALLAGIVAAGDELSLNDRVALALILREMRAETECARLAQRIIRIFRLPPLVVGE
jgi:hypothetical protein